MIFFSLLLLLPYLLLLLYFTVRLRPVAMHIKHRHVFITGGSTGIGLAIAKQAAFEGASRISLLARSHDKLVEAKQFISQFYDVDVSIFAADVRDYDAVQRAIKEAGPIDVLVVNQGVFVNKELENLGVDQVKLMIDVNLIGSFNVIKAALPLMKDRKVQGPASIALMSSLAGQVGVYGYTAYSATKFGLRGLAEALQHEVIADNIHVSLICPPPTETPGFEEAMKTFPELSNIIINDSTSSPMKAEEVAKVTLNGIKSGSFIIPCNFQGKLLALATMGMSPQRSFLMAFLEVVLASISRFASLCYVWSWYRKIEKWHAQKK